MPTYYSTLSNASYRLRLDVSLSSQDTAANTSTIAWAFYIERLAGTGRFSSLTTSGSATFGGGVTSDSATGVSRASYDFRSGVVTLLWGSGSRVITHNTDGTATLRSSAVFTGDGNIGTGSIGTQNWALPTIPRAATSITRNSGTETGSATTLGLSPLVSSFYYVLKYKSPATGTWTLIGPAGGTVGTSWPYSTTIAHAEIPSAGSGSIQFQVTTLDSSGGTQIGSPVETSFTYTVPASVLPLAGAPTWTEGATTTGLSTLTNSGAVFAQGWSKLVPTFSGTAGTGATVSTATAAVAGVTGTTTTGVAFANVVTTQGVGSTFTVTVTDSRSRTDTETGTVSPSVHRWSLPTANAGTPVITPTALTQTIALSGLSATSTSFYLSGSQRNVLETRTGYRDLTTAGAWVYGSWTAQSLSTSDGTDNAYAPGTALTVATGLDPTHEYEVTLQVRDIFGSNSVNYSNGLPYVASSFIVAAQGVLIAYDGNDRVGIKKVPTQGDLDIAGQAYQNNGEAIVSVEESEVIDGGVVAWDAAEGRWIPSPPSGGYPLGAIVPWAAPTLPTWGLEMNGQTVVGGLATYSGLAALFPGWVSGSDLILPDWGEQVPVGLKTRLSLGAATITIASPGVVTRASHGLADGQRVEFTTTGALPTGLAVGTRYFVRDSTATTFRLAATLGGTAINTSGSQSGTHTVYESDFTVLDESVGAKSHKLITSELASHTHTQATKNAGTVTGNEVGKGDASAGTAVTGNGIHAAGGDRPHNNVQPSRVVRWVVCAATSSGDFDTEVQTALVASVASATERTEYPLVPNAGFSLGTGLNKLVKKNGVISLFFSMNTTTSIASFTQLFNLPGGVSLPTGSSIQFTAYDTAAGSFITQFQVAAGMVRVITSIASGRTIQGSVTWVDPN